MKKAIFPGSFDPITLGHVDVIDRALPLFDEITIAIGINNDKTYMFSLEDRISFIKKHYADEPKIKVETYTGLTIDFCKKLNSLFVFFDFDFVKYGGDVGICNI